MGSLAAVAAEAYLVAEVGTACNFADSAGNYRSLGCVVVGCNNFALDGDCNSLVVVELSLRFSRSCCWNST